MKTEFFILFYDVYGNDLLDVEKISISLNGVSCQEKRAIELSNLMVNQYADERMIDLDSAYWQIHRILNDSSLISIIVEHLELKKFQPGWGSLTEIVIEYLQGWVVADPQMYLFDRYEMTSEETNRLIDEIRNFEKWRD